MHVSQQGGPDDPVAQHDVVRHDPAAWRDGVRTGVPTLFGIGAWGLVVGVAMIKSGLTLPQALGMTLLVFAGSAQLASLPLIAANAPIWVIFTTAIVINLRFIIFSALWRPISPCCRGASASGWGLSPAIFPLPCSCSATRNRAPRSASCPT